MCHALYDEFGNVRGNLDDFKNIIKSYSESVVYQFANDEMNNIIQKFGDLSPNLESLNALNELFNCGANINK
ncbi:hypothetical protein BIY23_01380 [Wolbachia pipientis]|uniref:Uncharacterized protein n=1 Tax=Wolbachia pipientis TaxID=955 RepID=A0A1E7QKW5_WOLPI|nr:hypothetical protein [Wolbachia pipientis]OEY87118.1 hypothetical protein BIY23_01380 [Wolbachia pipientis]